MATAVNPLHLRRLLDVRERAGHVSVLLIADGEHKAGSCVEVAPGLVGTALPREYMPAGWTGGPATPVGMTTTEVRAFLAGLRRCSIGEVH